MKTAKYEIKKIDVSALDLRYERYEDFGAAKELMDRLDEMDKYSNGWFFGKGSHIFENGVKIAHSSNYYDLFNPNRKMNASVKNLKMMALENPSFD